MCNTYFIKYITFNQNQMRVNGEFDEEKNLIEKRQAIQKFTSLRRAREGLRKPDREGKFREVNL